MFEGLSLAELLTPILTFVGIVLTLFKLKDLMNTDAKRREEYLFAKQFFQDLDSDELVRENQFVSCLGYRALSGQGSIDDIKFIVNLDNPVDRIADFQDARRLVTLIKNESKGTLDQTFVYKGFAKYSIVRQSWFVYHFLTLILALVISLLPFAFLPVLTSKLPDGYLGIVVLVFSFGVLMAMNAILQTRALAAAERLVNATSHETFEKQSHV